MRRPDSLALLGSGEIEFEEFAALAAKFVLDNEQNEGFQEELREAFRLYDKEVECDGSRLGLPCELPLSFPYVHRDLPIQ